MGRFLQTATEHIMALTDKYPVYLTCTQHFVLGSLYVYIYITRTKDTKLSKPGGWTGCDHKH